MKNSALLAGLIVFALCLAGCKPETPKVVSVDISVQLYSEGAPLAIEGVPVTLSNSEATVSFNGITDATGSASFNVSPGSYTASTTYKTVEDGIRIVLNGSNSLILVTEAPSAPFRIDLQKVQSQQLIIKELYTGGCPLNDNSNYTRNDHYVIIYNNSEFEADASDLVFGAISPYNAHSNNNKYYVSGGLVYENENWLPAGGAMWYFPNEVKIPAYSQIVIAIFAAIDHTATVSASVNLSDPSYYWMANTSIPAFTHQKHAVSESIPKDHYLYGYQINQQTAWTLSDSSPAFFIAKMKHSELEALCTNTSAYDFTGGDTAIGWAVKLPKANVIGAVEVFAAANLATSHPRFTSDVNTGYVVMTVGKGRSVYRNVDKDATEALPENVGKLVYNYSLGTADEGGSTDPSGIDAEASIAAGAHIIYSQTNDSGKDFHQRKIVSLKK